MINQMQVSSLWRELMTHFPIMPKVPLKMKVRYRKRQEIIRIANLIVDLTQITRKKQTWQEKKKQRNKQRQKFKKPKRLPYEETEAKPLELGELLENESLKTEEGISALAEDFNSSDQKPIELDEFLVLSLQELKEKVTEYDLNLGQGTPKGRN